MFVRGITMRETHPVKDSGDISCCPLCRQTTVSEHNLRPLYGSAYGCDVASDISQMLTSEVQMFQPNRGDDAPEGTGLAPG